MQNTIQRIKEYIDSLGIAISAFEKLMGFSNGSFASQLKNNKTIGVDKLEYILNAYPDLNAEWLLRGNGYMEKKPTFKPNYDEPSNIISEPDITYGRSKDYKETLIETQSKYIAKLEAEISILKGEPQPQHLDIYKPPQKLKV